MKMTRFLLLGIAVSASPALAQNSGKQKMRDSVTHQQLVEGYRKAAQEDPMRHLKPAKGADPSLVNQPEDLVATSDILCFGGKATLVPKRAILNVPKHLTDRLKFQPGSQVQSWLDFFAQNRGWITTVEVSRVQAEGIQPIAEAITERCGARARTVIRRDGATEIEGLSITGEMRDEDD